MLIEIITDPEILNIAINLMHTRPYMHSCDKQSSPDKLEEFKMSALANLLDLNHEISREAKYIKQRENSAETTAYSSSNPSSKEAEAQTTMYDAKATTVEVTGNLQSQAANIAVKALEGVLATAVAVVLIAATKKLVSNKIEHRQRIADAAVAAAAAEQNLQNANAGESIEMLQVPASLSGRAGGGIDDFYINDEMLNLMHQSQLQSPPDYESLPPKYSAYAAENEETSFIEVPAQYIDAAAAAGIRVQSEESYKRPHHYYEPQSQSAGQLDGHSTGQSVGQSARHQDSEPDQARGDIAWSRRERQDRMKRERDQKTEKNSGMDSSFLRL